MKRVACAIFDLDGVLTSTTAEHFQAWSMLFLKHFGIVLDPKLESLTRGVSRMSSLEVLLNHYQIEVTEDKKKRLANEKNRYYKHLIESFDEGNLLPGARQLLETLKAREIKIALASASKNSGVLLSRLKIESYFDYVVNPSRIKGKPNPDIFIKAQKHFGLKASECIGFEDAIAGIEAIKKARMFAIGVGFEELHQADLIVESLPQLTNGILDSILEGKQVHGRRRTSSSKNRT